LRLQVEKVNLETERERLLAEVADLKGRLAHADEIRHDAVKEDAACKTT
jgi:hypothetical protein